MILQDLFKQLQAQRNDPSLLGVASGADFEDVIASRLDGLGFDCVKKEDMNLPRSQRNDLLTATQELHRWEIIPSPWPCDTKHYIRQPFGSQQYPDFLVSCRGHVHALEVKFSSDDKARPVWNGGLPRAHGYYIFRSRLYNGTGDTTFFRGINVINPIMASDMAKFFDNLKGTEAHYNAYALQGQKYGFSVYVRRAYTQTAKRNRSAATNLFRNSQRKVIENNLILELGDCGNGTFGQHVRGPFTA